MDTTPSLARSPLRIARPSADLDRARRFWCDGLGLDVLLELNGDVEGGHSLLMVGWPDATWHIELVGDLESLSANPPGPEDLLVLYLSAEPDQTLLERLLANGGTRVTARNPYWEEWGVTIEDPDGYRLVLSRRSWEA